MQAGLQRRVLALGVLVASSWMSPAQEPAAQQSTGRIEGRVTSTTGAPVAGVTITVTCTAGGERRTAYSDPAGSYELGNLAPCNYRLEAKREGYEPLVRDRITVDPGTRVTESLTLTPATSGGWTIGGPGSPGLIVLLGVLLLAVAAVAFWYLLWYRPRSKGKLPGHEGGQAQPPSPKPPSAVPEPSQPPAVGPRPEPDPALAAIAGIRDDLMRIGEKLEGMSQSLSELATALRESAAARGRREDDPADMELVSVTRVYERKGRGPTAAAAELPIEELHKRAWERGVPALRELGARPAAVSNVERMKKDQFLKPTFEVVSGPGDLYLLERPGAPGIGWLVPRPGATAADCDNRFTGIPDAFDVRRAIGTGQAARTRLIRAAQVQHDADGWHVAQKGELELISV